MDYIIYSKLNLKNLIKKIKQNKKIEDSYQKFEQLLKNDPNSIYESFLLSLKSTYKIIQIKYTKNDIQKYYKKNKLIKINYKLFSSK